MNSVKDILQSQQQLYLLFRQGGGGQAVKNGGRGVFAAGGVQRTAGSRAGRPQAARPYADWIYQQPEGGASGKGEKAGGKAQHLFKKKNLLSSILF